mmetsp:Transcript_14705/g.49454  ORF Transcript_14705/g.49454 Transcript_14705/m.49454 type:complete len:310 (+) Transcript_14705:975-1904(+)
MSSFSEPSADPAEKGREPSSEEARASARSTHVARASGCTSWTSTSDFAAIRATLSNASAVAAAAPAVGATGHASIARRNASSPEEAAAASSTKSRTEARAACDACACAYPCSSSCRSVLMASSAHASPPLPAICWLAGPAGELCPPSSGWTRPISARACDVRRLASGACSCSDSAKKALRCASSRRDACSLTTRYRADSPRAASSGAGRVHEAVRAGSSAGQAARPSSRAMVAAVSTSCDASAGSRSSVAGSSRARTSAFSASEMAGSPDRRSFQRRPTAALRQSTASSRSAPPHPAGGLSYTLSSAVA